MEGPGREGAALKRLVLYSELALYPMHREALAAIVERYDVSAVVYGRPSAELPAVHRQLGWATGPIAGAELRWIPSGGSAARMRWLRHELRRERPDAVWVQQEPTDLLLLELLAVARTLPRTRIVGAACENVFDGTPARIRAAGRILWGRMDALAAVATASVEGIRAIGFPRSVEARALVAGALPPPEDVAPMDLGFARDTVVVGFCGRIVPEKGWRVLAEAVRRLPRSVAVAFAGAGPEEDELRAVLASEGLAGRSVAVGLLPKSELWRFYAALDALVVPSLTTPAWKEQFGGVIADGMASGLPIVGSSSGAIPEVLGSAGLVVPEGDAEALAESLRRLAGSPGLRGELGANGRARFDAEFSIHAYARKLAGILHLDPGDGEPGEVSAGTARA